MHLDALDHDVFPRDRFDTVYAMGDFHGDLTAASVCFALLARVATYEGDDGKKGGCSASFARLAHAALEA